MKNIFDFPSFISECKLENDSTQLITNLSCFIDAISNSYVSYSQFVDFSKPVSDVLLNLFDPINRQNTAAITLQAIFIWADQKHSDTSIFLNPNFFEFLVQNSGPNIPNLFSAIPNFLILVRKFIINMGTKYPNAFNIYSQVGGFVKDIELANSLLNQSDVDTFLIDIILNLLRQNISIIESNLLISLFIHYLDVFTDFNNVSVSFLKFSTTFLSNSIEFLNVFMSHFNIRNFFINFVKNQPAISDEFTDQFSEDLDDFAEAYLNLAYMLTLQLYKNYLLNQREIAIFYNLNIEPNLNILISNKVPQLIQLDFTQNINLHKEQSTSLKIDDIISRLSENQNFKDNSYIQELLMNDSKIERNIWSIRHYIPWSNVFDFSRNQVSEFNSMSFSIVLCNLLYSLIAILKDNPFIDIGNQLFNEIFNIFINNGSLKLKEASARVICEYLNHCSLLEFMNIINNPKILSDLINFFDSDNEQIIIYTIDIFRCFIQHDLKMPNFYEPCINPLDDNYEKFKTEKENQGKIFYQKLKTILQENDFDDLIEELLAEHQENKDLYIKIEILKQALSTLQENDYNDEFLYIIDNSSEFD